MGIPSSVDLVSSDPSLMVASFNSGHTSIFNMETRQRILTLESSADTSTYQKKPKTKPPQRNCLFKIHTVDSLFSVSKQLVSVMINYNMNYVTSCVLRCNSGLSLL